jgi:hypothetical protein|tara:strand:+ start:685 stop:891 length:207 start_codon:yes stop_codon:yes gene_type:complete
MKHSDQKKVSASDLPIDAKDKVIVKQQITCDFVLELWEKSKAAKGEEKKDLADAAELCSKNVGSWIVE